MTRYLKTALLAAAALLASCIHNDIPYPVVELRIASVEGQGFSVSENNVTSRTVTLSLDEATDIRNVRIDAVGYDAVIHSIQLDKEEVLQQIRSSRELTGTFDLRSPIYTTLSLYQDYEWTIRATQTIERRFSVTGQIGAHGDRGEKPHRPGPRPQRHRSGTYRGHGTQTRPRRHHDLFALARRAFGQQLRIGAFRRRHLPRNHRTVAALRGAYQCEGRPPGNRPVEQYGHGHRSRLCRGVCGRRRAGIPDQGRHGVAENGGEQLRGRHPDGNARAPNGARRPTPTGLPSTTSCRTRVSSQGTPTNSA